MSIFAAAAGLWHGLAYAFWTISLLPILRQLWHIIRPAWEDEPQAAVIPGD